MKRRAVYPGTFDPITNGHEDLVRRAAGIFDQRGARDRGEPGQDADVPTRGARGAGAAGARRHPQRDRSMGYSGLTVEFARDTGYRRSSCAACARSRTSSSSSSSPTWAGTSRREVETVFLTPQEQFTFISSTLVREIAILGGDVAGIRASAGRGGTEEAAAQPEGRPPGSRRQHHGTCL